MPQRIKRKRGSSVLPTELLSSLEKSDRAASTKRRKQFTSHTVPKSLATKSLYDIHTNLIESRILLQRALTASNDNNSDDDNSNGDSGTIEKGLKELLNQLVGARKTLCQNTFNSQNIDGHNDNESDTQSDDDDNDDNDDDDNRDDQFEKDYNTLQKRWKSVLNRHYDNINIAKKYKHDKGHNSSQSNKFFQTVDLSFWSQVENTVQHNMLLDDQNHNNDNGTNTDDSNGKSATSFDDSKIYQHMLQEYITLSTERSASNASSMAEHRLRLASKTNKDKNKSNVDRRASKGRKIRYVVHEKLKNFTFPLQREANNEKKHVIMDEDVLFKSMMGGVMAKR